MSEYDELNVIMAYFTVLF